MHISLRAYNREIEDLLENDQIDEVIAHCRHILQEFPRHLDTLRIFGKAALDNGNLETSTKAFKQLLASLPSDFVANLGLSFIHQNQGDLDSAIWYLERVYESNPNNVMVQEELKKLMTTRDGKMPDRLNKTNAILAQIYANSGEYLRAIEEITAIVADDPKRTDMKTLLAKIHDSLNDPRRTLEACDDCFEDSLYNFEALRISLRTIRKTGPEERIQELTQRLLELDPYAIDPSTQLFAEEKSVPDDLINIARLEWIPGEPSEVSEEPEPRVENMGGGDPSSMQGDEDVFNGEPVEPVEEIPVEQETPKWLKELLSEARAVSGSTKFNRGAGETVPDWVREMEAEEPFDNNMGVLNQTNDHPATPGMLEAEEETIETPDAEPDKNWEYGEWKPIPSEKSDPLENLAETRKTERAWYAERSTPVTSTLEDLESLAQTRKTANPLHRNDLENNPTEQTEELTSDEPADWRDNLDLDWIGEPREEPSSSHASDELSAKSSLEGVDDHLPDPEELDWLGDLSKPEGDEALDWLGDLSQPLEEESDSGRFESVAGTEGMAAILSSHLPDAPNIMLPEGSMLPKEPVEFISEQNIEELSDPTAMFAEPESEENQADGTPDFEVDENTGEDFYLSLQNPPTHERMAEKATDGEQTLIGSVGSSEYGNFGLEPVAELMPEAEYSTPTVEDTTPNRFQAEIDPLETTGSEPIEEIVPEVGLGEDFSSREGPIEEIDPEGDRSNSPELGTSEEDKIGEEFYSEFTQDGVSEEIIEELTPEVEIIAEPSQAEVALDESATENDGNEMDDGLSMDEPVEKIVQEPEPEMAEEIDQPISTDESNDIEVVDSEVVVEGMALTGNEPIGESADDLETLNFEEQTPAGEEMESESEEPVEVLSTGESDLAITTEDEAGEPKTEEQFIGSAFDRGKRLLENGNLDKALEEFSDLIKFERMIDQILPLVEQLSEQQPGNKRVLRVLGDAYFNSDRLEDALEAYARADELPDIPNETDLEL